MELKLTQQQPYSGNLFYYSASSVNTSTLYNYMHLFKEIDFKQYFCEWTVR